MTWRLQESSPAQNEIKQKSEKKPLSKDVLNLHAKIDSLENMQKLGLSASAMLNLIQNHTDEKLKLRVYTYVSEQDYDIFAQAFAWLRLWRILYRS